MKTAFDPFDLCNCRYMHIYLELDVSVQASQNYIRHTNNNSVTSIAILNSELQSAHRTHQLTDEATIELMSNVYEAADAGFVTLLGLLDPSAAFDMVDHCTLLNRLRHGYGLSDRVIEWIGSHITGRSNAEQNKRHPPVVVKLMSPLDIHNPACSLYLCLQITKIFSVRRVLFKTLLCMSWFSPN